MNRFTRKALPFLLISLAGAAAVAQPEPAFDLHADEALEALHAMAPRNAGLVYARLVGVFDDQLSEAARFFSGEELDPDAMTMTLEQAEHLLIDNQAALEKYIWASRLPEYDLGLQYDDGWGMILPHLGKLRAVSRVLVADARRQAALGEVDKAADRIEAVYNIAWQIRDDRVLISSLVSIALVNLANQHAVYLIEHDGLSPAGRDALVAALGRFQTSDPFRILECLKMEYTVSIGWLAKMPEDASPEQWLAGMGIDDQAMATLTRLNASGRGNLLRDAERMGEYYRRATQAWEAPDAPEQLVALGALAQAGAFGETGKSFLASIERAKGSESRVLAEIEDTMARLRAHHPRERTGATGPGARE